MCVFYKVDSSLPHVAITIGRATAVFCMYVLDESLSHTQQQAERHSDPFTIVFNIHLHMILHLTVLLTCSSLLCKFI